MERERLKETLNDLRVHLQQGGALDLESQQLLKDLSARIDSLISADESGSTALILPTEEKDSLLDRMLGLTDEFEESHPQLAEAIGNVAAALSRIGI